MKFLCRLFQRKPKAVVPPMPSREEIIGLMYDKQLDYFSDKVAKVIYSNDRSMRYVILKSEKGFFTYLLEAICPLDEEEWEYSCSHGPALPAMWESYRTDTHKSFFGRLEEALKEIQTEPEFLCHFRP